MMFNDDYKPLIEEKPPKLNNEIMTQIGIKDPQLLQVKFDALFEKWVNAPHCYKQWRIGNRGPKGLKRCSNSALGITLLADDLHHFQIELAKLSNPDTFFWLEIAGICGSQQVGNWLIQQMESELRPLNDKEIHDIFSYVASSQNWVWLEELVLARSPNRMPDACYKFLYATDNGAEKIKALSEKLFGKENIEYPKNQI